MKKRIFLFTGVLCSIAFYSCQKSIKESDKFQAPSVETLEAKKVNVQPENLTDGSSPIQIPYVHDNGAFSEGPAVDKFGNVFFTEQNHDKIYRWDAATGEVTLWLTGAGNANGMAFDKDGSLIACADMHGELWKIRPDGSHEVLVDNYDGKLLNGPNDVWINPVDRGMYITDAMFPRGYWDPTDPRKTNNPGWPPVWSDQGAGRAGHVYYLAPGSKKLVRVTTMADWHPETAFPNGVVGTTDGKKLYVNKWAGNPPPIDPLGNGINGAGQPGGIWVFDINKDGTLSNMQPFVTNLNSCDGMSLDEFGNVYVSSGGIKIYNPQGVLIQSITTPGGAANNVFAGLDQKTLFITGGGGPFTNSARIFTQKMNVRGVEKFGGEHFGQTK